MLSGDKNMELKMKGKPPNIQDDVERTKGAIENIELKMKGPPPNIQDDIEGTEGIIEEVDVKLNDIQDDVRSTGEIIKRPAGCYIIR